MYGTDKEKTLFIPQDPFYRTTAEECVDAGVGVNLFLFPSQYIDVASLGVLPGLTGGELFFYPRFEPVRDGAKLRAEIRRVAERETGYSVTMRIRCSNGTACLAAAQSTDALPGLRIADHFGNFFQRNVTDLEFGMIDADKAIAAKIKHEGKLDEKVDAHFQCAILYTSANGQRRVRVHNLAVPVSSLLANVFRLADMDTTLAYIAKECESRAALLQKLILLQPSPRRRPSRSGMCEGTCRRSASSRCSRTANTAPRRRPRPKFVPLLSPHALTHLSSYSPNRSSSSHCTLSR